MQVLKTLKILPPDALDIHVLNMQKSSSLSSGGSEKKNELRHSYWIRTDSFLQNKTTQERDTCPACSSWTVPSLMIQQTATKKHRHLTLVSKDQPAHHVYCFFFLDISAPLSFLCHVLQGPSTFGLDWPEVEVWHTHVAHVDTPEAGKLKRWSLRYNPANCTKRLCFLLQLHWPTGPVMAGSKSLHQGSPVQSYGFFCSCSPLHTELSLTICLLSADEEDELWGWRARWWRARRLKGPFVLEPIKHSLNLVLSCLIVCPLLPTQSYHPPSVS